MAVATALGAGITCVSLSSFSILRIVFVRKTITYAAFLGSLGPKVGIGLVLSYTIVTIFLPTLCLATKFRARNLSLTLGFVVFQAAVFHFSMSRYDWSQVYSQPPFVPHMPSLIYAVGCCAGSLMLFLAPMFQGRGGTRSNSLDRFASGLIWGALILCACATSTLTRAVASGPLKPREVRIDPAEIDSLDLARFSSERPRVILVVDFQSQSCQQVIHDLLRLQNFQDSTAVIAVPSSQTGARGIAEATIANVLQIRGLYKSLFGKFIANQTFPGLWMQVDNSASGIRRSEGQISSLLGIMPSAKELRDAQVRLRHQIEFVLGIGVSKVPSLIVIDGNFARTYSDPRAIRAIILSQ